MKLVSRKLAALVCCLLMATVGLPTLPAQQTDSKQTDNKAVDEKTEETKQKPSTTKGNKQKRSKRAVAKSSRPWKAKLTSQIPNPVSLVNETDERDFLSGQVRVVVKGNQDPIIRLGLARNGSTVVEFPASDRFFAVHPGSGSNIVSVDESATLETDHFLVFRAGKDFVSHPPNSKQSVAPQATVSVQMRSGMFITLIFYPVSSVTQMAHRCVVTYARDEVVEARRKAGLAVNLNERESQDEKDSQKEIKQVSSSLVSVDTPVSKDADSKQKNDNSTNIVLESKKALQSALSSPTKFTVWSKPLHGLSVSSLAPIDINNKHRLVIIAVKNRTSKVLQLIEGQPDIDVVTVNKKGQIVLIQSLVKLHVETTTASGVIPANSITYFAVLYESPVLSANQRLRFSVANRDAADEPVTAILQPS